jgi:hypothetical protein
VSRGAELSKGTLDQVKERELSEAALGQGKRHAKLSQEALC